jgi:hypothetical protein
MNFLLFSNDLFNFPSIADGGGVGGDCVWMHSTATVGDYVIVG